MRTKRVVRVSILHLKLRMLDYIVSVLLIVLLAIQGGAAQSRTEESRPVSNEEYAVYSVVLNQWLEKAQARFVVIMERASYMGFQSCPEKYTADDENLGPLSAETLKDFALKNCKSHQLERKFNLKAEYILASDRELSACHEQDIKDWSDLCKKAVGLGGLGRITLSRVGFNQNVDQALLYITIVCGPLCGSGNYLLLVKKNKVWTIQEEQRTWIS